MIIEREGVKFYAPDSATGLVDGAWTIDDSQLVPWSDYQLSLNIDKLLAEKTKLETELSNIVYADSNIQNQILENAIDAYNEPLIAESIRSQERIDEIVGLLA